MDVRKLKGMDFKILAQSATCIVIKLRSCGGDGMMTFYELGEGICVIFNDFHTDKIKSEFYSNDNILCIDYCNVGRFEQELEGEKRIYIGAGDVRVDDRKMHQGLFYMPLSHYHGITLFFELDKAQQTLDTLFPDCPINMKNLQQKYCSHFPLYIIRNDDVINGIFNEMYREPNNNKLFFLSIKMAELLLRLDEMAVDPDNRLSRYFYKSHTEKVKQMYELMTNNLEEHYTLNALSYKFDISLTTMKLCFKEIYGESIFRFMKKYRMSYAAKQLLMTKKNISEIAEMIGYESPGKFSHAFKSEVGVTPSAYRHSRRVKDE